MENFNIREFLTENKLTNTSKRLSEAGKLSFSMDDVERELKNKLNSNDYVVKRYGNKIDGERGVYVKENDPSYRQSVLSSIDIGADGKVWYHGGKGTGTGDLQKEFDDNASLSDVVKYIIKRVKNRL